MNIRGKKVTLRAIEEEDLPTLHRWSNDPDIWYQLGGWHFPSSKDYIDNWFRGLKNDQLNQRFAVEAPEVGLIGTSNIVEIDWKNNHAFHGMMLGDKEIRGKGYGVDTIMATMRYAFEELHLERLDGSMIEYNEISLNIYLKKCGWKEEGRQRGWYFRKNRYWDKIVVGVTRQDYGELVAANRYWDDR
ncbi:MAG TPA: GNAT family protein [Vicinamibacterales bacterium]|jgi:RimJ/RimL family protein N-acetyltransferase